MAGEDDRALDTVKLSGSALDQLLAGPSRTAYPSLFVYHRDGARVVPLAPGAPVVVGRAPPSDVIVSDVGLSRQHARFTLEEGEVVVEDLGSTNGTLFGAATIERARIKPGDEVTLGGVTVSVDVADGERSPRGVAGYERFRTALEEEIGRASFFRREASLVFVRAARRQEGHVRLWHGRVQSLLRPVDRVGLYSDDSIEILLPETGAARAAELARAIAAAPAAGTGPQLFCGVASFPDQAASAEELLSVARAAAGRTTAASTVEIAVTTTQAWAQGVEGGAAVDSPVSSSAAMRTLLATAAKVARGSMTVLLHGETGSGKEVLARFLHETGPRKSAPILCVNCAAIAAQLLESTLFGHEKGSFTGATQQQKGVFESADGGTVFLDEIGELPAAAQAALLRVLETKRFARVGSTKEIVVDVRVIAATHRDLEAMVREGRFREDLFYRLNTVILRIPPLRDRREDVAQLADRFLAYANQAAATAVRGIDPDAHELLRAYSWPGNVRELKNAIERAVAIAQGDIITVDDLPERVREAAWTPPNVPSLPTPTPAAAATLIGKLDGDFRSRMERLEAEVLTEALRDAAWNQTETARRLQMPLRTLVYKLRMHGIKKPRSATEPPK